MNYRIVHGEALACLRELPDASVHCCVTSPPYWGLRDYGVSGQLGLETTPEEYVSKLVDVLREVRRVLRDDGTLWLNLGDSYSSSPSSGGEHKRTPRRPYCRPSNLKPKDLVGIPWLVAFSGSGTTGMVALRHGRNYLGIELRQEYVAMSHKRIVGDAPLFNEVAV